MGKHAEIKGKTKKKNKKKKKHLGIKFFLFIVIILGVLGGILVKRAYDLEWNWIAALMGHTKETRENLERVTVLIMGESGGNTDSIMIVTYDPKIQEAAMLSIPRDTFAGDNPSSPRASDKINSLYHQSPEKVVAAVNKITGLNIEYYLIFDTAVLIELVDIIGGIEYDVPIDMKYDDFTQDLHIDLKKGVQKLNGAQVEQLVRFRHNNIGPPYYGSTYPYDYGIEDYGRMKTQRNVAITIAKQTIKLKNIWEIGNIIDSFSKNVTTNVEAKAVKDYIPYGMQIDISRIRSEQLPGNDSNNNSSGIWFFYHDKEKTKTIVEELFSSNIPKQGEAIITGDNDKDGGS